jgi:hypothetical protein
MKNNSTRHSFGTLIFATAVMSTIGCRSGESEPDPEPQPAYRKVHVSASLQKSPMRQQLMLDTGVPEETVILKVPARAIPEGVDIQARVVTGIRMSATGPIGDTAIEITPYNLSFAVPVRARLRITAPGPMKRYATVHADSPTAAQYVQTTPARRVGLGSPVKPESEEWEIDLTGGGLWGVANHSVDLGGDIGDGTLIVDEVEVPLADEEQVVFIGPTKARTMLFVPAEPNAEDPAFNDRNVLRRDKTIGTSILNLLGQTIAPQRGRTVVVQSVSPVPTRPRTPPLPQTAIRVRTLVSEQDPAPPLPPVRVRVVQPLPEPTPPVRGRTPVRAPETEGAWAATGEVRRSPVPLSTNGIDDAGSVPPIYNYEYELPWDSDGYWGIADQVAEEPEPVANLFASPPAFAFAATVIGQNRSTTITITNSGNLASTPAMTSLSGPGAAAFELTGDDCSGSPLAAGASCSIVVTFKPSTATAQDAILRISGGPVDVNVMLTGNGVLPSALSAAPALVNFGSTVTGVASAVSDLTITNTGGSVSGVPVVALAGANAAEFAIVNNGCMAALTAGQSCKIGLRFTPTARGARAANVGISATPGGSLQVSLMGTGQAPGDLRITPPTFGFGNTAVNGQSVIQVFTVSNPGDTATGVPSVGLGGAAPSAFTIVTNRCTAALAATATCTIDVRFNPSQRGMLDATLQVSASPGGSTLSALSGTGQSVGALTASTPSLNLGSVIANQMGTASPVTITNTGDQPTGTLSVARAGGNAADFSIVTDGCAGQILAGGATCSISLRFDPKTTGNLQATLDVSATPGGAVSVALQGIGLSQANVSVSPSNANLGSINVGATGTATPFMVLNMGAQATGVPAFALVGANANQFMLGTNNCAAGIAGGGSCTVNVLFAPTSRGVKNASLQITTNPGGMALASLSGTGLAPASLTATPNALVFGSLVVGTTSSTITSTFANPGDLATAAPSVAISGANASDFAIVSNSCSGAIAGGGSCIVGIAFTASQTGARTATLTVNAGAGASASASLTGTGLAPAAMSGTPPSLTFGSVQVNTTSGGSLVTITNTGAVATGAISATLGGTNPGDFARTSNCTTLAPSASCTVSVTATPVTSGNRAATLSVQANPGGVVVTNLSVTGLAPANLTITPADRNFGNTIQGKVATAQSFTITNTGGAPSSTLAVSKSGNDASLFTISANTCLNISLNAGATCTVSLTFNPLANTTLGGKSGTLTVTATTGGTVNGNLSGTVLEDAVFVSTLGQAGAAGTRSAPLRSVQAGIDAAVAGGFTKVLVSTGSYNAANGGLSGSVTAGIQINSPLTVTGGWDTAFTQFTAYSVLDAASAASHVVWISSSNVTLQFFTIQGGTGENIDAYHDYGGGILIGNDAATPDTVLIDNVTVTNSTATQEGAGIASFYARNVTISNSAISNCTAMNGAGGISFLYNPNATISRTTISGNTGFHGGAHFSGNQNLLLDTLSMSVNDGQGGSDNISIWGGSNIRVQNSDFTDDGNAILLNGNPGSNITGLVIDNNVFSGAMGGPGGAAISEGQALITGHQITNNRFDLGTVSNLYRNHYDIPSPTPATPAGLTILNTPNHANHNAAVASGNAAY